METRITNITLEKDRFIVFATICGNEETRVFEEIATAKDVIGWVRERKQFYKGLENKVERLKEDLINREL